MSFEIYYCFCLLRASKDLTSSISVRNRAAGCFHSSRCSSARRDSDNRTPLRGRRRNHWLLRGAGDEQAEGDTVSEHVHPGAEGTTTPPRREARGSDRRGQAAYGAEDSPPQHGKKLAGVTTAIRCVFIDAFYVCKNSANIGILLAHIGLVLGGRSMESLEIVQRRAAEWRSCKMPTL
uniref:Uncharacterized protein n=1 Tax=Steinernema glaseri TaxID=37863 RepID=A0A1I8AC93_9BILA